ncbi:MAG: protein kinase domain-containing protein, partial [Acidobacteriota bacterium]
VLEYIEGRRINHYCEQNGLSVEARLRLFREACLAVAYAHEQKVIHRDIKPANILVTNTGQVKLLDFGIARVIEGDEESGYVKGERTGSPLMTYDYASPEQILGERVGAASDIYSLGVVLYQLIEGRLPYELPQYSPLLIIKAVVESAAPPIGSGGSPWMNQQLDGLIGRAMAKQVGDRYPSVRALLEDLEAVLEGRAIKAGLVKRSPWRGRTARAVALLLLVLTAVLAGALWGPLTKYWRGERYKKQLAESRRLLEQGEFLEARARLGQLRTDLPELAQTDDEYSDLRDKAELPRILTQRDGVDQSMITGDGRFLLTTSLQYADLNLWDLREGALVRKLVGNGRALWSATHIDPREALLIEVDGESLTVEDLLTGRQIARCAEPGRELAGMLWYEGVITYDQSGEVKRWNLADCRSKSLLRLPPLARKGIDGRYNLPLIAAKNGNSLTVWNLQTGRRLLSLVPQPDPKSTGNIDNFEFDEQLRFCALERLPKQVEVYELQRGRLVTTYQEPDSIHKIIVDAARGRLITFHDGGKVKIRSITAPGMIREIDLGENISDGLLVDGGEWLLAGTERGRLALIDPHADHPPLVRQLHSSKTRIHLRYDQAQRQLVTSGTDGTARIWPLDRLVERSALLPRTDGWINSLALSPDGERLLVGARDNLIRIWNVATRRIEKTISGHTAWVLDVAYSPDGQLFSSASTDGLVKVWRAADGQLLHNLDHGIQVHAAIFSPDGETIASASSDGHLRLWETVSGRLRLDLAAHRGEATCVAWSPTQDLLVTGGYDGQVTFWDPGRG